MYKPLKECFAILVICSLKSPVHAVPGPTGGDKQADKKNNELDKMVLSI